MSQENRDVVRRWFDEGFNRRNLALMDQLFAPDYVWHGPSQEITGRANIRQMVEGYLSAFPDAHVTSDEVLTDGDKVVTRFTFTGSHKGKLGGVAPTGRSVTIQCISINRIAGGQIAEEWESFDELGMMRQIGAFPSD